MNTWTFLRKSSCISPANANGTASIDAITIEMIAPNNIDKKYFIHLYLLQSNIWRKREGSNFHAGLTATI